MSLRLTEFLATEAGEYIDRAERLLDGEGTPPTDELVRLARAIRGSARMADAPEVARAAERLESAIRNAAASPIAISRHTMLAALRDVQSTVGSALDRARTEEDVIPISELFYDDEGPHIFPPASAHPAEEGDVVPITALQYSGDAALRRAGELRDPLADAIRDGDGAAAAAIADEVFDLIRLARGIA